VRRAAGRHLFQTQGPIAECNPNQDRERSTNPLRIELNQDPTGNRVGERRHYALLASQYQFDGSR
jgi:hypothetical protein